MHIFFSGIGGAGIGPLALIAKQAGFEVSGSDKQNSDYIEYLNKKGIDNINIGQSRQEIEKIHEKSSIDWVVFSSAIEKENENHPELVFAKEKDIKTSKRDEFLVDLIDSSEQKLIAVAGTHGKSTTTAMLIWLFKSLNLPVSYSVGAKLPFGEMGEFDNQSSFFVYEADEYDRNFLAFHPKVSVISGIDYDHPDIYPTREDYYKSFRQFLDQSEMVVIHELDAEKLGSNPWQKTTDLKDFKLVGEVNRKNAQLAVETFGALNNIPNDKLIEVINQFPGLSRRFEKISDNLYTDYAHTPEKVRGAVQTASELSTGNLVVVYEGLHNTRQHFIKKDLETMFSGVSKLYIVPSYRARENEALENLTPEKLVKIIQEPAERMPAQLDDNLKQAITSHVKLDDLVLCLSAGGGGSLDEWLRRQFGQSN